MGCGYLMLNFWEEGKGPISSYNMQDKALMILWFMIYTFGTAAGIINTLTSIYIYEWGMQISFLKYKKKIEWEEFSVIRRYHNHFFFNMSKQKDAGPYWAMFHPFTSFTFTIFMYSLAYAFGNVGEAAAVVLMVIQVAGSGGTFPVEVLPKVFQYLYKYMPFASSVTFTEA